MILYFSGTGNSRFVAEALAAEFGEECRPLVPSMRGATVDLSDACGHLIWVFPVYSWGVPPYVRSIMRTIGLRTQGSVLMHAVMTDERMWGQDLTKVAGFEEAAVASLEKIRAQGALQVMKDLL